MKRLSFEFGIGLNKAYVLTMTKKEAVIQQLDVWRFRNVRPRNTAGWMIQAIENNYEVPNSYFAETRIHEESQQRQAAQAARRACTICDGLGFRRVTSLQYPDGAMRPCSHNPLVESKDMSG